MTEERAKKILDWLAKKIGWDEVTVADGRCIVLTQTCIEDDGHGGTEEVVSHSSLYVCRGALLNSVVSEFTTYAELLDNLLQVSSTGWSITTNNGEVFLPAETALEQILLEMDLLG